MQQITGLSASPKQEFKVQIESGDIAIFNFYYLQSQIGWFFDIEYGNFKSTGLRLVNSLNVLSPYFNILRFGLMVEVPDKAEPYFLDDFISGRVNLYILSESEVKQIEETYYV
jgi:hypothetical protein